MGCIGVFCMKKKLLLTVCILSLSSFCLFACSDPEMSSGIISEETGSEPVALSANIEDSEDFLTETGKTDNNTVNNKEGYSESNPETENTDENLKTDSSGKDDTEEQSEEGQSGKEQPEKEKIVKEQSEKDSDKTDQSGTEKTETEQSSAEKTETEPADIGQPDETSVQAEVQRIELEKAEAERIAEEQAKAIAAEEALRAAEEAAKQQAAAVIPADDGLAVVNAARAEAGLGPVVYDATLNTLAYQRAVEIAANWGHNRPDGSICFSILDQNGVDYRTCGENIAAGQETATDVVNSWLNSEGHRVNILNGAFHKMGLAVYNGGEYGTYWVQIFTD